MKSVLRFLSIIGILAVVTGNYNEVTGVIVVLAIIGWLFWPSEKKISEEENI